ncbi:hypothetical protein FK220_009895 [Flavobacteriaceae bacterium TP-CH-4]|uniref:Uncharacterized protein n=1 Tax=Pelagihabitans pacificus TaxID=2696054 RepID=A0A967AV81_9FLAO|nr:hypothetical protein [Pelagihabitans pacificus]NHF59653.1 hypothetical protein [Pelagihabitans pacificus]
MKHTKSIHTVLFIFLAVFVLPLNFAVLHGQSAKKNSVRLTLDYVKVMNGQGYLDIKAISRIDKQMTNVPHIDLKVYYEFEDEEFFLGNTATDAGGKSSYILPSLDRIRADSTNTYTIGIAFEGNDRFKRASKTINFKDANITTKLATKDSVNYIEATLTEAITDLPIAEIPLKVQVKRLIHPLPIGEEFNYTDENGTVIVPVEEGIPGRDGNLTLEVVLSDSDDYGTVKDIRVAPFGVPIIEESTFNENTLWGPRGKTPLFILLFTLFLVLVTWGPILYLIRNLYRITKS